MPRARHISIRMILTALCSVLACRAAVSQDADSLLARVTDTYKDLRTYHVEGEVEVRMRAGRQTQTQSYTVRVAERFPTHFHVAVEGAEAMAFVADGTKTHVYDGTTNEYLRRSWVLRPGQERADIPALFGVYKRLIERTAKAGLLGDTLYQHGAIDTKATLLEVIPRTDPSLHESVSYRLWVDPQTDMVVREDLTRYIPDSPYGGPLIITQTTRYTTVSVGVSPPDSIFTFSPPAGAREVNELRRFPNIPESLHGQPAKPFSLERLNGGGPVVLDSLKGRPVVLNFWATWCGPCRAEMDALQKLQNEWASYGLKMLAINQEEVPADVRPYIEANGYTFDVLLDRFGLVSLQYEVDKIPTTFVIDRKGVIREHLIGARTEADFREAIGRWIE